MQNQRHFGNHVVIFINHVMNPVQYTSNPQAFARRRDHLNTVLSFSGLYVGEDGKVRWSQKATNLDQALEKAGRLHASLTNRGVHCCCRVLTDSKAKTAFLQAWYEYYCRDDDRNENAQPYFKQYSFEKHSEEERQNIRKLARSRIEKTLEFSNPK
jgi:hypothetical protein